MNRIGRIFSLSLYRQNPGGLSDTLGMQNQVIFGLLISKPLSLQNRFSVYFYFKM